MALSYALSPRGVRRLRSTFYKTELSGVLKDMDTPALVSTSIDGEERLLLADSMILCRFCRDFMSRERDDTSVPRFFKEAADTAPVLDRDELERPVRANVILRGRGSEGVPPVQKRLLL